MILFIFNNIIYFIVYIIYLYINDDYFFSIDNQISFATHMSIYIDKAINEAKKTSKYVIVCVENLFGKGLLSNDSIFRKISLNFVPYTTSAGSEGFKNFFQDFLSSSNCISPALRQRINLNDNFTYEEACAHLKGRYLIVDPENSEIVDQLSEDKTEPNNQTSKITEFDLLIWLQAFLDSRDTSNQNKKQHSRGQRFPKPRPNKNTKGVQKNIENEFHLTPHTEFEDVKNIMVKFVSPDGAMKTFKVNKDKKIVIFLKPICKELNLDMNKLVFTFDARTFDLNKTVRNIHLQNNSVIYSKYKTFS